MTSPSLFPISPTRSGWFARRRVEERMDAPDLAAGVHREALAGLRRINTASNVATKLAAEIIAWAKQRNQSTVRLLDVACGGGDVPIHVARAARDAGLSVELTLADRSETALREASALAEQNQIQVTSSTGDATRALPDGPFDVVTNSLFLHHLDEADVVAALSNMRRAGRLVLISDLRRSPLGWAFAWIGCRVLSRSPIVHFDGPVSVRGAWTIDEIRAMAAAAGMSGASVVRQWPFRMLLRWERDA